MLAFLIGGLVVLATGHNPLSAYREIFNGTGLNWIFPWVSGTDRTFAALNLQQTLIKTTPLMLTGLAVAFAFRCGMFNIGGQGQYTVGTVVGVWVGSSWAGGNPGTGTSSSRSCSRRSPARSSRALPACSRRRSGARGDLDDHAQLGRVLRRQLPVRPGRPAAEPEEWVVPISNDIATNTHLHVFWGDPILQGLHIGFFIAIAALVAYWVVLSRTTLGYEVRAVGFNPEAARYGGINVARSYVKAMAISGLFAGLAGAIDILGWQFRLGQLDVQASNIGFTGIAVALLGRNTAVGVFFSALLFGGLINGTSGRHLSADVFPPQLAGNLTLIIQGLIILFIGADVLVLYVWQRAEEACRARRRRRRDSRRVTTMDQPSATPPIALTRETRSASLGSSSASRVLDRLAAIDRAIHRLADPRRGGRTRRRALGRRARRAADRLWRDCERGVRRGARLFRDPDEPRPPQPGHRLERDPRGDAPVRDTADVRRDRRHVLGAQRRRQHRPRGDDADGRVSSASGGDARFGSWEVGIGVGHARRRPARARPRVLRDPPPRRPDRRRHRDQLPRARHHRLPVHPDLRRAGDARGRSRRSPTFGFISTASRRTLWGISWTARSAS